MMKKKILKALAIVGCAVLLVAGSIAGTFAYLTSQTQTVTNTFTAGKVAITLDEAIVDEYGNVITGEGAGRTSTGRTYKLIPGHEYVKDPTIYVAAKSEVCYLYIKVENEIAEIELNGSTIENQLTANGWAKLEGKTNIWYKTSTVDARNSENPISVATFTRFTVNKNATNDELAGYAGKTVKVTAYAIQADGFGTAQAAWEAASTTWIS